MRKPLIIQTDPCFRRHDRDALHVHSPPKQVWTFQEERPGGRWRALTDAWKRPPSAARFDLSSSKHLLWSLPSAASVLSSLVPACRIYPPLLSTLFLIGPINLFETGGQTEACGSGRGGILPRRRPFRSQPALLISPLSADTCVRGAQIPPRRLLSLTCAV